jgi:hypothetical protein
MGMRPRLHLAYRAYIKLLLALVCLIAWCNYVQRSTAWCMIYAKALNLAHVTLKYNAPLSHPRRATAQRRHFQSTSNIEESKLARSLTATRRTTVSTGSIGVSIFDEINDQSCKVGFTQDCHTARYALKSVSL